VILGTVFAEEAFALEKSLKGVLNYADYLALSSLAFGVIGFEEAEVYADKAKNLVRQGKPTQKVVTFTVIGQLYAAHLRANHSPETAKPTEMFSEANKILKGAGRNEVSASAEFNLYASWALWEFSIANAKAGEDALKKAKSSLQQNTHRLDRENIEKKLDRDVNEAKIEAGLEAATVPPAAPREPAKPEPC